MKLGIRLLFVFFLLNGLAAFFVLRVFVVEIRPSVREVMEDMMVDTANILAELASDDLAAGRLTEGRFAAHVRNYASRPVDARIWGLDKQSLDFILMGKVLDEANAAVALCSAELKRALRG